jgi:hypothetical protein
MFAKSPHRHRANQIVLLIDLPHGSWLKLDLPGGNREAGRRRSNEGEEQLYQHADAFRVSSLNLNICEYRYSLSLTAVRE